VEAALAMSPYVENIMIHADPFNSYCVALVVVAQSELEKWATQQGLAYSDFSDLCQKQEAVKEVLGSLATVCVLCSSQSISDPLTCLNSIRHRSKSLPIQVIFTILKIRKYLQQYMK
jgi:hypothetical protein